MEGKDNAHVARAIDAAAEARAAQVGADILAQYRQLATSLRLKGWAEVAAMGDSPDPGRVRVPHVRIPALRNGGVRAGRRHHGPARQPGSSIQGDQAASGSPRRGRRQAGCSAAEWTAPMTNEARLGP